MRMGDLVTGFGDVKIESAKQLVDAVKKVKPGESRQVTFIRFTENGRSTVSATANF
jgi:S1-C subfamily serine protease